ncbi:MAG: hypothetical protein ACD_3C00052G0002 [uncultured bacterium (gcode 4)]|uniref:Uncharacterized protein n=1 Tax=uncultured bacterium (gcode 4) TaxID=1234023 RepID=K2FBJ1_9BACT|nr:MAG: hypothetical protein ACD_3C00052G0002 [uncultured bacterium (gcode 4)]
MDSNSNVVGIRKDVTLPDKAWQTNIPAWTGSAVAHTKERATSIFKDLKIIKKYDFKNPNREIWRRWENLFGELFAWFSEQGISVMENVTLENKKVLEKKFMILKQYFLDFFKEIFFMTETWEAIISRKFIDLQKPELRTNKNVTYNWLYHFLLESMLEEDLWFLSMTSDYQPDYNEDDVVTEYVIKEDKLLILYSCFPFWKLDTWILDEVGHIFFSMLLNDANTRGLLLGSYNFKTEDLKK